MICRCFCCIVITVAFFQRFQRFKAKFIIKEPTSKTDTLVYLIFRYQYRRFKYSTGEKIKPKFWNTTSQRVKATKQFTEYPEFNSRLDKI